MKGEKRRPRVLVFFLTSLFALQTSPFLLADSLTLSWSASPGATGYKIYQSTDQGQTWVLNTTVTTTTTRITVPSAGLILLRVSAVNAAGESLRSGSGWWYNGGWVLAVPPATLIIR